MESSSVEPQSVKAQASCPLCRNDTLSLYHSATGAVPWRLYSENGPGRDSLKFFRCGTCALVVKDPEVRSSLEQERAHYAKHNNDISDDGYRAHLCRLLDPIQRWLPSGATGLDYGCGPALSIEVIARERGLTCLSYDPHFFPSSAVLRENAYDFITCSEVAEHFASPAEEFERLRAMLKDGGVLGVMTQVVPEDFADWWYHRDPTHRVFYSAETFRWISARFKLKVLESLGGVCVFQKSVES